MILLYRIVASLSRIFTDISPVILDACHREITFLTKTKAVLSNNQIDTKSRFLRYVGELVKFTVAPPIVALKTMNSFLTDFSSHNIEFMSVLMESCGR